MKLTTRLAIVAVATIACDDGGDRPAADVEALASLAVVRD